MSARHTVTVTFNGREHRASVPARRSLADFLRDDLQLTGTHLGCEHGMCGACTVLLDGAAVRSCILYAVQVDGAQVTTVEGLSPDGTTLSPLQDAFVACHGLQCGFCTPGMLIAATELLRENAAPSEDEIRTALGGNLCRCTGYQQIVESVQLAARGADAR
ncbi:MAG TPA: (2Fe-2S)-binding protein [Candidatus Sulfotelmatobacter sp.]|nr:(2Fe-2S)-binding protein [Candidatus Sulfotelmatobacter sp.]